MRIFAVLLVAFATMLGGCGENVGLPADPGTSIRYPISLVTAPDGRSVYVAGANFDRKYRAGILRRVDTATDKLIGTGLEVPGYAGGLAMQLAEPATPAAAITPTDAPLRLLLTSRDDDGLSLIDVGATLTCGDHDSEGHCDAKHRYGHADSSAPIGNDPVGIDVIRWPGRPGFWRVTVASNGTGKVTVLQMDAAGKLTLIGTASFGAGLSHVKTVPATGWTYITDMLAPQLHVVHVEPDATATSGFRVVAEPSLVLPSLSTGDFTRGMAVSSDGSRLYVADRSPRGLLEIDVSRDGGGVPRNALVSVVPVGPKPAEVVVAPTGPGGRDLAYVTCFGDDAIWIVDPSLRQVVGVIRLPHGPYGIAVANVPASSSHSGGWTLYAGLFARHAVAVVPIDPAAPDRYTVRTLLEGQP